MFRLWSHSYHLWVLKIRRFLVTVNIVHKDRSLRPHISTSKETNVVHRSRRINRYHRWRCHRCGYCRVNARAVIVLCMSMLWVGRRWVLLVSCCLTVCRGVLVSSLGWCVWFLLPWFVQIFDRRSLALRQLFLHLCNGDGNFMSYREFSV